MAENDKIETTAGRIFDNAVTSEIANCLGIKKDDQSLIKQLQARLEDIAEYYRQLICLVPSDLPGAPFPEMSLTKRHHWIDSHVLNPVARIREALSDENRPLRSTWPEFMTPTPQIDIEALSQELDKLENLGKYLWMSARLRRDANVTVGWEIKFEIVRAVTAVFIDLTGITPSRGTYDTENKSYIGKFPEAITLAYREITKFENGSVDRQIAEFVEQHFKTSMP